MKKEIFLTEFRTSDYEKSVEEVLEAFRTVFIDTSYRLAEGDCKKAAERSGIPEETFKELLRKLDITTEYEGELRDCYEASAKFCLKLFLMGIESHVVQGTAQLDYPPYHRYGHAWVEVGDFVIDVASGARDLIESYYKDFKIQDEAKFKPEEALYRINNRGHWGPWKGDLDA